MIREYMVDANDRARVFPDQRKESTGQPEEEGAVPGDEEVGPTGQFGKCRRGLIEFQRPAPFGMVG